MMLGEQSLQVLFTVLARRGSWVMQLMLLNQVEQLELMLLLLTNRMSPPLR